MYGRPRRRQWRKTPGNHMLFITFFLFVLAMIASILVVNEGIKPVLLNTAEVRVSQIANQALGIAVSKKISEDLENGDLVEVQLDDQGRIENYVFNAVVENRVQRNVQYRLENFLKLLESGERPETGVPIEVEILDLDESEQALLDEIRERGLLIEIPVGQALGIPLLANLGPRIPVNIEVLGSVGTETTSEIVQTGINGALIQVNVFVEVEMRVVIPFASKPVKLEQHIPVTKVFHPGDVPNYYHNGEGSSNLSIPIDPQMIE
ncbi:sporulation protein YunB [Gracilibacillus alcaliphilus]|uniref:sporulation protein YunB n=1 Tax=Gracilibacillus alcaliphilus TaxID=1401441 RepID=UPI00195A0CF9|nr:sporulation protein YunB [Gracilibacillus alcaliphilus]MBM7675898.1 sporulation protein YunB [Gracilibacillus alcaliphilus]